MSDRELMQPEPPQECKTEKEKTAFAFGWWKAIAAERERIKQENAPVIERINAHIKALEDAVADEREACAALVDANAMACHSPIYRSLLQSNADAIRARGNA